MSVAAAGSVYAVGAAALGLWAVVRFPARGPASLTAAVAVAAAAYGLLLLVGPLVRVAAAAGGTRLALPAVVLPILTFAFWSCGHVVRTGVDRLAPYRR